MNTVTWIATTLAGLSWDGRVPVFLTLFHVVFLSLAVYIVYKAFRSWRWTGPHESNHLMNTFEVKLKLQNERETRRDSGVWTPQTFDYPEIIPCPHQMKDIKPVPYRPFRWGEYHVTMGIRAMPWAEWIELDESFSHHRRIRAFRVNRCGKTVLRVLPAREDKHARVAGGAEAVKELLYELVEYLPRRYPSSFHISRFPLSTFIPKIGGIPLSWHDKMPVKTIEVIETGETYDLGILESMSDVEMGEEAFRIINGLIQDDIAIMTEGTDGNYYFQAGLICVPGFWRLRDKIGMPLDEIHLSGDVPRFKERLQLSMNRFFQRLPLDKPVIRNNYSIQVVPQRAPETSASAEETLCDIDPEELSWSETHGGPEDDFVHGRGHGARDISYISPSTLRLRSERQTLRRLPRTGAIVFGIRTYQFKVDELAQERGVAARLASAVRSWPEDVALYKGRGRYRDVLLGYLDRCAKEDGTVGPTEEMPPFPY